MASTLTLSRPVHRVIVLGLLGAALAAVPLEVLESLPSVSIWQRLFGWAPSVGITRGSCALLHGDFARAISFNVLSIPAVIVAATIFFVDAARVLRGRRRGKARE